MGDPNGGGDFEIASGKDKDGKAFRDAMSGVRPLEVEPRATDRAPRKRRRRSAEPVGVEADENLAHHALEMGEEIGFRRPGVADRTFRRLRRGDFSIQAELDLHGLTVEPARRILRTFIVEAAETGLGCVRVIHGRGLRSGERGPVLKENVNAWLRHWDEVLAFVTARARDGGAGAIYVLLRRRS